jgi:hypothetical protein
LRAALAGALALMATAAGCGKESVRLEPVCTSGEASILRALAAAPGQVSLAGGVRLSQCVDHARTDADLQSLGFLYGNVARQLAEGAQKTDAAAGSLGYLVGAARRGGAHSNGIHAELVRRLEQSTGLDGPPPAHRAAYRRGLAAGEASG